jgi:hypothetical protein
MLFLSSSAYFFVGLKSRLVRGNFFNANAIAQKVTTTITATTKMSAGVLNSGAVGVGDADVTGAGDAGESEESDITETVLEIKFVVGLRREGSKRVLVTNISFLPES